MFDLLNLTPPKKHVLIDLSCNVKVVDPRLAEHRGAGERARQSGPTIEEQIAQMACGHEAPLL